MNTTKAIQTAVARADLTICEILRALPVIAVLTLMLLILLLVVRARWPDPYFIDYDAPGVDITSEGPEGYTQAYHDWSD